MCSRIGHPYPVHELIVSHPRRTGFVRLTNVLKAIVFRQLRCREVRHDECGLPLAATHLPPMAVSSVEALPCQLFLQLALEPRAVAHQLSLARSPTDPLNGHRDQVNLQSSTPVLLYPPTEFAGVLQRTNP